MNYGAILIELCVAALGVLLLVLGVVLPKDKKGVIGYVSGIALLCILVFSFINYNGQTISFVNGLFTTDSLAVFFKQVFIIAALLVTLMSVHYVKKLPDSRSEYFVLILFASLGMMVMASSNDLMTLYIGLELMSLSFIILSAYDRLSMKSTEAGTKYVLLSAMSSAVLLYGMSLIYGISGSVEFTDIASFLKTGDNLPMFILGGILVIAGFAFKVSAAPFHMWAPDIYEGAPTPVTAFLAGGSKVAAFAAIIKVLMGAMAPQYINIGAMVLALSVLSMVVGNILAISQTNLKRMLAYSGIAHAGYILVGVISYTNAGISAMLYYMLLYVFANVGAFAAITAFSNQTGKDDIKDFKGMWKRSPFLSATLMVSLLCLAGIPPAAGFIGKFYLFSEAVKQGYLPIAIIAMAMSVVSAYYYITVIRVMLMDEPEDKTPVKIPATLVIVMAVTIVMILVMGLYPGPITSWTTSVASAFMK